MGGCGLLRSGRIRAWRGWTGVAPWQGNVGREWKAGRGVGQRLLGGTGKGSRGLGQGGAGRRKVGLGWGGAGRRRGGLA